VAEVQCVPHFRTGKYIAGTCEESAERRYRQQKVRLVLCVSRGHPSRRLLPE